jgi:hypothetical protein
MVLLVGRDCIRDCILPHFAWRVYESKTARAHGPKMLPYGATWWKMPVFTHSSPIYLDMPGRPAPAAESARLLLDQLGYFERWVESAAHFPVPENRKEALAYIALAKAIYSKLAK